MKFTDKEWATISDIADAIQKEGHKTIDLAKERANGAFHYQDAYNVFVYRKLAEFEYRLRKLEGGNECAEHCY